MMSERRTTLTERGIANSLCSDGRPTPTGVQPLQQRHRQGGQEDEIQKHRQGGWASSVSQVRRQLQRVASAERSLSISLVKPLASHASLSMTRAQAANSGTPGNR